MSMEILVNKNWNKDVGFDAGAVLENILFFSDNTCNALISYDLTNNTKKYICGFPEERNDNQILLHKQCLKYKNEIIFIPNNADNVHIFDVRTSKLKVLPIEKEKTLNYNFCGGIIINNFLWIFPGNIQQKIIKINLSNYEICYKCNFYAALNKYVNLKQQAFWKVCHHENNVYLALLHTNKIVKYNLEENKVDVIETDIENLDSIYEANGKIYVCTLKEEVYIWDNKKNKINKCKLEYRLEREGSNSIIKNKNGIVFLVPNYGLEILKKQINKNTFYASDGLILNKYSILKDAVNFENYDTWGDNMVLFPCHGGNLVIVNEQECKEIKSTQIVNETEYKNARYIAIRSETQKRTCKEGVPYLLNEYIKAILD